MKSLSSAGKYFFAIPFIIFGFFHFMNAGEMAGMMLPDWPLAVFLVYSTGLALILAGISIIIDKMAGMASFLLAIMLFLFIVGIHVPGMLNEETMQMSMGSFLKDFSLMGAALTYSGLYCKKD